MGTGGYVRAVCLDLWVLEAMCVLCVPCSPASCILYASALMPTTLLYSLFSAFDFRFNLVYVDYLHVFNFFSSILTVQPTPFPIFSLHCLQEEERGQCDFFQRSYPSHEAANDPDRVAMLKGVWGAIEKDLLGGQKMQGVKTFSPGPSPPVSEQQ
jgi:hypothetical protein